MSRSKKLKVAEYSPSNNKAKGKIKLSEKLEECLRWFEEGNFVDLCIDVCNQFGNFYPSDIFGSSIKQGVIRELYAKGLIKKTLIEVYGVNYWRFEAKKVSKNMIMEQMNDCSM